MNRNLYDCTISKIPSLVSFKLSLIFTILFVLNACKNDQTKPNDSPIDPAFIGVWYASSDSVGFEVQADGTSKTLIVDTAGKLQYSTPGPVLASAISLTIINARNGNLTTQIRYRVTGFIDTTVTVPGVYTFSNNNNTISITFPNPLNNLQSTMIFQRSSIGAIVKPRPIADLHPGEKKEQLNREQRGDAGIFENITNHGGMT